MFAATTEVYSYCPPLSLHAVLSIVLVSAFAAVRVGGGISAAVVLEEQPVVRSLLYGASIAALGVVFTGVAAVSAQLMSHGRGAVGVSLAFLAVVLDRKSTRLNSSH